MVRAYFISDRSGFRFPYEQRVKESTGFVVGPNESDGDYNLENHPQNKSPRISAKYVLKDARPEKILEYVSSTSTPAQSTAILNYFPQFVSGTT